MNRKFAVGLLIIILSALLIGGVAQAEPSTQTDGTLSFYENNPILVVGEDDAWDSGAILAGHIIYHDEMYHMFYSGTSDTTGGYEYQLGHATSPDGLTWAKDPTNPILTIQNANIQLPEFEEDSTTATRIIGLFVSGGYVMDDTWVLYVIQRTNRGGVASTVRQVTSSSPSGPFTVGDANPLPAPADGRAWDEPEARYEFVLPLEDSFVMYYSVINRIGYANSPDGIAWNRYDDSATGGARFGESDPVLVSGPEHYIEPNNVHAEVTEPHVFATETGWEMFYRGESYNPDFQGMDIGIWHATSPDGIQWEKSTTPIWSAQRVDIGTNAETFGVAYVDGAPVIYSSFADDSDFEQYDLTSINAAFWEAP